MEDLFGSSPDGDTFLIGSQNFSHKISPYNVEEQDSTKSSTAYNGTDATHSVTPQELSNTLGQPSPTVLPFDFFDQDEADSSFELQINSQSPGNFKSLNHTKENFVGSNTKSSSLDFQPKSLFSPQVNKDVKILTFAPTETILNQIQPLNDEPVHPSEEPKSLENVNLESEVLNVMEEVDDDASSVSSSGSNEVNHTLVLESHVVSSPTIKTEVEVNTPNDLENDNLVSTSVSEKAEETLHEIDLEDDNLGFDNYDRENDNGSLNLMGIISKIKIPFMGSSTKDAIEKALNGSNDSIQDSSISSENHQTLVPIEHGLPSIFDNDDDVDRFSTSLGRNSPQNVRPTEQETTPNTLTSSYLETKEQSVSIKKEDAIVQDISRGQSYIEMSRPKNFNTNPPLTPQPSVVFHPTKSNETFRNTDGIDVKYRNRVKLLEKQLAKEKEETNKLQKKIYDMVNEKSDSPYEAEVKSLKLKLSSLERQLTEAQSLSKKWKQQYEEKSLSLETVQEDNQNLKQELSKTHSLAPLETQNLRLEDLRQRYEAEKNLMKQKYETELEREKKLLESDKMHIQKLIAQIKEESQKTILSLQAQITSQNGIIERLMNENSDLLETNKLSRRIMMESKVPGSTGSLVKENRLLQKMLDDVQQISNMLERENTSLKIQISILEGKEQSSPPIEPLSQPDPVPNYVHNDWNIVSKNFTPVPSSSNTPVPTPSRFVMEPKTYPKTQDNIEGEPNVIKIDEPLSNVLVDEHVPEEDDYSELKKALSQPNNGTDLLSKTEILNEEERVQRGWVSGLWSAITFQR